MPRGGKKWTPAQHRKYAATMRAKRATEMPQARTINSLDGISMFNPAFAEKLDAETERLQKVRDLLR